MPGLDAWAGAAKCSGVGDAFFPRLIPFSCEQLPFCLSCVLFFREALLSQLLSLPSPESPTFPGEEAPGLALGLLEARARLIFPSPSRICCLNWEQGKLCLLTADAATDFLFHLISRGWSCGGEGGVHQP